MYAIRRGAAGQFLAEGPVYTNGDPPLPSPLWQHIDGDVVIYTDKSLRNITRRKERLEKIYIAHKLKVVKLTDEQMEFLTYRKLKGH